MYPAGLLPPRPNLPLTTMPLKSRISIWLPRWISSLTLWMAEAEGRAGGNYSWNTGVNYFDQFRRSIDRQEVKALYQQAGLNLQQDLDVIQEAPRISAD